MSLVRKIGRKIGIITLGCDKNTVDNEYLGGLLEDSGFEVVPVEDFDGSEEFDAIVINTCGFILDAKKQSAEVIAKIADIKKSTGNPRKFVVVGCLAQRYAKDILKEIPEIDAIFGVGQVENIAKFLDGEIDSTDRIVQISPTPIVKVDRYIRRRRLLSGCYSYLKIADGCSHKCAFCAIPRMKGKYTSVPLDILLKEAEDLLSNGVKEINLIAQDITRYGRDLNKGYGLAELIKELVNLKGDFWIRCLYCLPSGITKKILNVVANEEKVVHYLDMPIQHTDYKVLKLMNRPRADLDIHKFIREIREFIPDIVLRSTIIVGFPGETFASFKRLLKDLEHLKFERLGAFIFSPEEGTPAERLSKKVSSLIAERRLQILMETQSAISYEYGKSRVGRVNKVLVEKFVPERQCWIGRSYAEAPDVDGVIWVNSTVPLQVGNFYNVNIKKAETYDLIGDAVI
ncbi:MAG: 30S ribosomal protein S12 methylthiotransferase RimO [Candidatus Hydrogenedentes bacterium]|nr:30S ribosomal protein S12 methylthiotransferase RimO [Candidatus Hydrogenedentota bacterium]